MAGPAILKLEILADASKAVRALGDTEKAAGGAAGSSGLGKLAKVGAMLGGTAAIVGFGKASVTAATESKVATERLNQVMKQAGDSTGEASKAAQEYASQLSKRIGVEDEAIMAGQAQLATFQAVSSEAARTSGIFDRATHAGADLAAAGFGSIEGNAVQLGKALQDPTKGLSALGRAGVTFTDSQKASIAAMQESGDLLGAQNAVLKAVEGQVGGTAEATVTSQQKMSLAFGETQEAVGNMLLPVLEKLAPILQTVATFVQDNVSWLLPLAGAIAAVVLAVKAWNVAQLVLNSTFLTNPIVLALAAIIGIVILVVRHWDKIKAAFAATFDWVKRNWPLLLAILTGPIGLAVLAIVRNWETIKAAISGVFAWIKTAASDVWRWVTDKFRAIRDGIVGAFAGIVDIVKRPINAIITMLNGFEIPRVTIGGEDPLGAFGPSIPRVTIGGWGLPHIPKLELGGTVMRTGLALVHRGEQFSGVGRTLAGGSVVNVTVNAGGLGADSTEIQRAVVRALRGHVARNGPLDLPVRSA